MTMVHVPSRILIISGWLAVLTAQAGHAASAAPPQAIDFNRDIRPILSENCFACHGQDAGHRKADLRLDVREPAIEAGAIVPGDVAGSTLVERIMSDGALRADAAAEVAPRPHGGAEGDAEAVGRRGREVPGHWAFVAPVRPALPEVTRIATGCRNAIDRFVLAKLEASGLKPAAEADRATLIRRLSLDLLGLPPSAEEVEAFVEDRDPKPTRSWSSGCSRARTLASGWPSIGSTRPGTRTPTASRSTAAGTCGSGAIG